MTPLHPFVVSLFGGFCIGIAAVLMMVLLGRIAGITGIIMQGMRAPATNQWALAFVAGLPAGAVLFHSLTDTPMPPFDAPLPMIIAGGFTVGFGARLGSGCTSGHGICGLGRFSVRSIIAVCTFMLFAFLTVFMRLHGGVG